MSRTSRARSRIRLVREGGRSAVVLRPSIPLPFAIFLVVWLAGWAVGEVSAIRELARTLTRGASGPWFLAFWLAVWSVGGALALGALAFALRGREEVWVEGGGLRIRSGVGPLGRTRSFDLRSIARLRAEHVQGRDRMPGAFYWPGTGQGEIAFDHGARTIRFGDALDPAEVSTVLQFLRERIPTSDQSSYE